MDEKPSQPKRNFYGRRIGKPLKKNQAHHMDVTLGRIAVDLAAPIGDGPTWLEIGFGGGEHLLHMAKTYPDITIIGAEAFLNGVAKLVSRIGEQGLENVRIHHGDARDLLEAMPDAALEKAFLLYPDPWPKQRHLERRFVNGENLDQLARVLKPGAVLRVATDIDDYVKHTLKTVAGRSEFTLTSNSAEPWSDWTRTRYEAKAIREGRPPRYLTYTRV
jgi:tRNA (guanine-N7-)-methyltransferase